MTTLASDVSVQVRRFEVRPSELAGDPVAARVVREAKSALGVEIDSARTAKCYIVEAALTQEQADRVLQDLLVDPVLEVGVEGGAASAEATVEVWPLPGVMDPAAQTVRTAIAELLGVEPGSIEVTTGIRYDFIGVSTDDLRSVATQLLSNPVIEHVEYSVWTPTELAHPAPVDQSVRTVDFAGMNDERLMQLSKDGHLFLNLEEMRAIRDHFAKLGRAATDIELETIAQTWSEHCVHKTLKAQVRYTEAKSATPVIDFAKIPGCTVHSDGSVRIDNLLKRTVAAATFELIEDGLDWTLSIFVDNSGVIRFDDETAVCMKVETHNRPSAIEPYGGAATGIGGCIRDIIGTGLAAKPIANTDVFCVANPEQESLPPGVLHPRRILTRVVDGVRDYGNRMGIPTVNGAVHFDDRYIGNPLVFAGCIGILPIGLEKGDPQLGDLIVALGGRTGKDGIHGATFSSGELTDTHADEFSHAVQIGNAIEEKRVLDAILRARDAEERPLYSAITDCGAGGFSSAVGEMGEKIGASVDLEQAPLKYTGLRYDEVWISESQERMVLAVPQANLSALQTICDEEHVEFAVLGTFGHADTDGNPELILRWEGSEVGRLSMPFLHDGVPMPTREAVWGEPQSSKAAEQQSGQSSSVEERLLARLADPNTASKRWIVQQYDHEVQGGTVAKPLVGIHADGPGDGAVIQPARSSRQGLAIANGLSLSAGNDAPDSDPYRMAIEGIDECVRNLVCVGADPSRIAILDNFCWPSCDDARNMAALVRACVGCYNGAKAYRTPFVSGKDSLNNQFRYTDQQGNEHLIEIPYTLLISGMGIVPDIAKAMTSDAKPVAGSKLLIVRGEGDLLEAGPRTAHLVAEFIANHPVLAAHDASEGGVLTAAAEMLIGGHDVALTWETHLEAFAEHPTTYLLQIPADLESVALAHFKGIAHSAGTFKVGETGLDAERFSVSDDDLRRAFFGTLDW
ncbi:MAG: phosphoribosylformylglycinamidine synthase subunit PurS [Planctomycetota bacterium]